MGLDQSAYVGVRPGQRQEFYEGAEYDPKTGMFNNPNVSEPRELAYWRKHPNLQGWMEKLWFERGRPGAGPELEDHSFNGIELELTREDLDRLEEDVREGRLPSTEGFFFGSNADDHYREQDLKFIIDARAELFLGLRVFYNSSW